MKLAEALIRRSDLQRKQEHLCARVLLNVKVQDGEAPSENPNALLKEMDAVHDELTRLVKSINVTNVMSHLKSGMSLSDAIVERDLLLKTRNHLSKIAAEASELQHRYANTEIKTVTLIAVAVLQKKNDALSKQHRELDTLLQEANWLTEIV